MATPEAVLIEFNDWMYGIQNYDQLSAAGQAYVDEYLEEYWHHMDSMCAPEAWPAYSE